VKRMPKRSASGRCNWNWVMGSTGQRQSENVGKRVFKSATRRGNKQEKDGTGNKKNRDWLTKDIRGKTGRGRDLHGENERGSDDRRTRGEK